MSLKLKVTVLPNDPPSMSWSGSAGDKLKLAKMKIQDRLQYLAGNADIVYKTSAWNTIKDKAKAEILIKSGLGLVQNAKYVEAIQSFNHAIRITPKVSSHSCCVVCQLDLLNRMIRTVSGESMLGAPLLLSSWSNSPRATRIV